MIIVYNSDDSYEVKIKTQKKTTFENDSDYAIPKSRSKLNKTVSHDDTDSGSYKFVVCNFLFVPRLALVCILYFLYIINYLHMLTSNLDFASFWAKT